MNEVAAGVKVVVGPLCSVAIARNPLGIVEVLQIEDVGRRLGHHATAFIGLIPEEEEPLVLGQPSLVDVAVGVGAGDGQLDDVGRVGHVQHPEVIRATGEEDAPSGVGRVGTGIGHHLGVVDIRLTPAPEQGGIACLGEIIDEQAFDGIGTADIGPLVLLMDDHVVCPRKAPDQRVRAEGVRWTNGGEIPEAGQVKDLQFRIDGLAHDHHVVAHHLDVTPEAVGQSRRGQLSDDAGLSGIGHLDEPGSIAFSEEHVLPAIQWVRPSPQIIGRHAARILDGHMPEKLHIGTGPLSVHHAIDAGTLGQDPFGRKTQPRPDKERTEEEQRQAAHGSTDSLQDTNSSIIICVSSNTSAHFGT